MKKILTALLLIVVLAPMASTIAKAQSIIPTYGSVDAASGRTQCEYVQLWADGPKWATFNVGATITDYANPVDSTDASEGSIPYYNTANAGGLYAWQNPSGNARKTTWTHIATGVSDVATVLWGSNWKTPEDDQLDDLTDNSKTTWTWCDGSDTQYVPGCTLRGYKVSGVGEYADRSIFLPAAGYFDNYTIAYDNDGQYWSCSEYDDPEGDTGAYALFFDTEDIFVSPRSYIEEGRSVRAVFVGNDDEEGVPDPDNLESVSTGEVSVSKKLIDGRVLIVRNGTTCDLSGNRVE